MIVQMAMGILILTYIKIFNQDSSQCSTVRKQHGLEFVLITECVMTSNEYNPTLSIQYLRNKRPFVLYTCLKNLHSKSPYVTGFAKMCIVHTKILIHFFDPAYSYIQ